MRLFSRLSPLLTAALVAACHDPSEHGTVVARAGDQKLTVEDAARFITPHTNLPPRTDVVRSIADLWVDYTLLATAAVQDTTMTIVDASGIINDMVDERILRALRDSVIRVQPPTASELQSHYSREALGSLARVRHIFLAWPADATPAVKDSIRRTAADLRTRLASGKLDFASTAKSSSQDAATASRGGDMGLVARGQLVPSLDSAIFALRPGELGRPVESRFGVHIVEVQARSSPTLDEFRKAMINHRAAMAESAFVKSLERSSPIASTTASATVRALARNPHGELDKNTESLLRYRSGQITRGDVQQYFQQQPPAVRNRIAAAADDSVPIGVLLALAHRKLLLAEAKRRGFSVRRDVQNQLSASAARNLADAARQLGLMPVRGEDPTRTIPKAVTNLIMSILSGEQREVTPLGPMSYALRRQYPSAVFDNGVMAAVSRLEQARRVTGSDSSVRQTKAE